MKSLIALTCLSVALLSGCASAPPLATASGRPEIVAQALTPQQALDVIASRAAQKGSKIKSVTPYSITLARPATGLGAALLFGSRYDATPETRVTFTVIREAEGTRVYATGEMVTNPGSAFERVNDLTDAMQHDLQGLLRDTFRGYPLQ